jgi:hypothetical protein
VAIVGFLPPASWAQATLAIRLGGVGLRDPVRHAPGATVCSCLAAATRTSIFTTLVLPADALLASSISLPVLTLPSSVANLVAALAEDVAGFAKPQREVSRMLDEVRYDELKAEALAAGDLRTVARLVSLKAPGCGIYLTQFDESVHRWLEPEVFKAVFRFRLGAQIFPAARYCECCQEYQGRDLARALTPAVDVLGDHAISCMKRGLRVTAHNGIRDALHDLCAEACLAPHKEYRAFAASQAPEVSRMRIDVALIGVSRETLVDVALTHPLHPKHFGEIIRLGAGYIATRYEAHKVRRYGEHVGPTQTLAPCVVDTFGVWSATAQRVLKLFAAAFGARTAAPPHERSRAVFFGRLSHAVQRSVGSLLLQRIAPLTALAAPRFAPGLLPTLSAP